MSSKRKLSSIEKGSGSKGVRSHPDEPPPKRASVFSRLGTKGKISGGYSSSKSKFGHHPGRAGSKREGMKESGGKGTKKSSSGSSRPSTSHHSRSEATKDRTRDESSPAIDPDWEKWDEKNLDYDDELMLEKKRQLLQRELAKQLQEQEQQKGETSNKLKKNVRNMRPSSSSSGSTSDSSQSDSSGTSSSGSSTISLSRTKKTKGKLKKLKNVAKKVKGKVVKKVKSGKKMGEGVSKRIRPTDTKKSKVIHKEKRRSLSPDRHGNPRQFSRPTEKPEHLKQSPMKQERDKFGFYCTPVQNKVDDDRSKRSTSLDKSSFHSHHGKQRSRSPVQGGSKGRRNSLSPPPRKGSHSDRGNRRKDSSPPPLHYHSSSSLSRGEPSKRIRDIGIRHSSPQSQSRRDQNRTGIDRSQNFVGKRRDDRPHGRSDARNLDSRDSSGARDRSRSSSHRDFESSRNHDYAESFSSSNRDKDVDRKLSNSQNRRDDRYDDRRRDSWDSYDNRDGSHYDRRDDKEWDNSWRGSSNRRGNFKPSGANSIRIDSVRDRGDFGDYRGLNSGSRSRDWSHRGQRSPGHYQRSQRSRSREKMHPKELSPKHVSTPTSDRDDHNNSRKSREKSREARSSSVNSGANPDSKKTPFSKDDKGDTMSEENEEDATDKKNVVNDTIEEEGEVKEELKDLPDDTEAFSDFGESDDEILNKEEKEEGEEGLEEFQEDNVNQDKGGEEEGEAVSRSSSRKSTRADESLDNKDENLLEGISDEDLDVSDQEENVKQAKAKLADALGVDWGQLINKSKEDPPIVTGTLQERWSLASVLKRIGISKTLLGEKRYDEIIQKANENITSEDKKFKPVHDLAFIDVIRRRKIERSEKLFKSIEPQLGILTGKKDNEIRSLLNVSKFNLAGPLNTDVEWHKKVLEDVRLSVGYT